MSQLACRTPRRAQRHCMEPGLELRENALKEWHREGTLCRTTSMKYLNWSFLAFPDSSITKNALCILFTKGYLQGCASAVTAHGHENMCTEFMCRDSFRRTFKSCPRTPGL